MSEHARIDYDNTPTEYPPGVAWEDLQKELLEDPEFAAEVARTKPYADLVMQVIGERIEQKLTQGELAERIGTKQGNISRFENMNGNPSLEFMQKIAEALGKKLEIRLIP